MTGSERGTYYQIGQEASAVTESTGVYLKVVPSAGSWENIVALFNSDTEFAIFQVDAFITAAKNLYRNTAVNINDDIHVVMPLYREEIHLIKARDRSLDFSSQKSFVVGCGPENSGSCLTASVLEDSYGKQFEYDYDDYESSFDKLRAGSIDLVIVTAGKPYPLLVGQEGLELVALPSFDKSKEYYSRASLGPDDYPWMENEVVTYAVRSVLATMIHEEEGLANDLVGSVHFALRVNEERLKNNGHPKWNDVLFTGYIEGLAHAGALRSLSACKVIKSYGYHCTDMASR
jgi:TRAP-type uncharacterized transport system substrate-binding protein